jgi:hypothetical protein
MLLLTFILLFPCFSYMKLAHTHTADGTMFRPSNSHPWKRLKQNENPGKMLRNIVHDLESTK